MSTANAEEGNVAYAAERLDEWARWLRASLSGAALGYPSAAPFVQQRTSGSFIPAGEPDNDRAEEVERIMCRLRDCSRGLYKVLYVWYVARSDDGEQLSLTACAQECGVPTRRYRDMKRHGEHIVYGMLIAPPPAAWVPGDA